MYSKYFYELLLYTARQPIHPQIPFPHWPPYSIIPQHQQIHANQLPHFTRAAPLASNNCGSFGGFGGFPGFGAHFGNSNIPGSASTFQASSSMEIPKRPTPKRKTKTKGDLEKELAELKQISKKKLTDSQAEITKLRSDLFNDRNALQNESTQKDALDKIRQSEEFVKKAAEEKNKAEKWKGAWASSLTEVSDRWTKLQTENAKKSLEIESLKGELDAEKKKNEEARKQMKNFQEQKEKNESKLRDALLKSEKRNIDIEKVNEGFKNIIQTKWKEPGHGDWRIRAWQVFGPESRD